MATIEMTQEDIAELNAVFDAGGSGVFAKGAMSQRFSPDGREYKTTVLKPVAMHGKGIPFDDSVAEALRVGESKTVGCVEIERVK